MEKILNSILYLWQLPQNIIGLLISLNYNRLHKYKNVFIYSINKYDGLSLGNYIFIDVNSNEGILFKHEYGHHIQSLILGWLYIPIIVIPSFIWFYINDDIETYYSFYTESWANELVGI